MCILNFAGKTVSFQPQLLLKQQQQKKKVRERENHFLVLLNAAY